MYPQVFKIIDQMLNICSSNSGLPDNIFNEVCVYVCVEGLKAEVGVCPGPCPRLFSPGS